jgi:hypothetical protein
MISTARQTEQVDNALATVSEKRDLLVGLHALGSEDLEQPAFGRVGRRRGASCAGPFPTAPLRTGRARFPGIRLSSARSE